MAKLYFFHCENCENKIPLFEDQLGWIDKEGNIGYYLTFEKQPDGNHVGEWEMVTIHDAMCITCNKIYGLIFNELKWALKSEAPTLEEKSVEIIKGERVNYGEGEIKGHKIYSVTNSCPKCQGNLLTASQLVERAKLDVESRIVELKPEDTKERIMLCPACKRGIFQFDYAIKYS
ncbi:MAG: hypothetical protein JXA54_17230 [Candidatus Heimdallarchaeota archaeon]|nr:hypothetical protein [Candidatus Heimdallarchaeota archaeon]